jgi:2,4-dienoyl-CoA reductase-like NADH-dependent reductase (Old Yellow Enzyme family)
MSALFTPTTLRSLEIPNRVFISPMCQYSAVRGEATAWHMIHLGSLALSGAGMLIIEATAVEPDGRITPGDLGLWDDATENALRPVLAAIRQYSKIPVTVQLAHAGRKASSHTPWEGGALIAVADGGWMTHAPSAIAHKPEETPPLALDTAGLLRIKEAFVASARRAARLGIDGIELHCAHGYLLHEFLSPIANQRTDEYGGSRENRMRYPLEIFDAVRAVFPEDKPVGVRVSASDWVEGGWNIDDTIAFAHELKKRGVDWIDVSSGGVSPLQKIPLEPGYQVPFAKAVKEATGVTTVAVGLITEPKHAEAIVASGEADYVAIARAALYDARWPWHAAAELGASVQAPPQYWRSQPREQKHLFGEITIGQR